ncbi:hypothetical protein GCM10011316_39930 [Roseibium aquae]|uniref:Uncharacterized protein n=1 Tax=Roseibium aquae TaxID=1323746 RepID=A0A916TNU9_9HYPH|nr:hypothetical protein GCM10011316_39930 [Roseibium aquae]
MLRPEVDNTLIEVDNFGSYNINVLMIIKSFYDVVYQRRWDKNLASKR